MRDLMMKEQASIKLLVRWERTHSPLLADSQSEGFGLSVRRDEPKSAFKPSYIK
jgi:hypothetical protein